MLVFMTVSAKEPPRLSMSNISKRFGATRALRNVDLEVFPGEVLALVGENGAGKSTLMKVLSGAHQPDSGEMLVAGKAFRPRNPMAARRFGVAMIYQELSLAPHLSVMENILLGIEPTTGPFVRWSEIYGRARAALDEIGLTDVDPKTKVRDLSLAQQQMVEIARAISLNCQVLVLDEPTSSLAREDIEQLFILINRLKERGIAIVYISHFLEEVKEISDRITVLRDGESVGSHRTSEMQPDDIVTLMVGRDVDDLYPRSCRDHDGEVVLDVSELSGVLKPRSAAVKVRRGQVVGIAGLVGAGRTELIRAIFGLDRVKTGEIKIAGVSGSAHPACRWQAGVGMVSEDRKNEGLALNLSIAENITLPKLDRLGWGRFIFPSRQRKASQCWIEKVEVKCAGPGQLVSSLSGGNQQKVVLAKWLQQNAEVLIFDEPTRGIDVGAKQEIYQLMSRLAANGTSIIMISSELPEVLGMSDRILVMHEGRITGEITDMASATQERIMEMAIC